MPSGGTAQLSPSARWRKAGWSGEPLAEGQEQARPAKRDGWSEETTGTGEPAHLPLGGYLGQEGWKALAKDRKGLPIQGKGGRLLFLQVAVLLVRALQQSDFSSVLGIPRQQEPDFGKAFSSPARLPSLVLHWTSPLSV